MSSIRKENLENLENYLDYFTFSSLDKCNKFDKMDTMFIKKVFRTIDQRVWACMSKVTVGLFKSKSSLTRRQDDKCTGHEITFLGLVSAPSSQT